ncbi:MAG: hypothetical protein KBT57_05160 [bacterium]|nr:hypothetical protein [Candidatus Limimorpha equi]
MNMEHEEIIQQSAKLIKEGISTYTTIQSALLDEVGLEEMPISQPMQCMQDFLDAEINGDKDTAMKKLFAAGIALANDSGVLPLTDNSPEMISTIADDTLTRTKVAYQVATGDIQIEDVTDTLIDNAAARAMAVADVAVENGLPLIVERVCDAVSLSFPPLAEVALLAKPILKHVAVRVAPKVKEVVKKGISVVSSVAKQAARRVIDAVRETGRKVGNWLQTMLFQ